MKYDKKKVNMEMELSKHNSKLRSSYSLYSTC